jgi:hypothetical protein
MGYFVTFILFGLREEALPTQYALALLAIHKYIGCDNNAPSAQ